MNTQIKNQLNEEEQAISDAYDADEMAFAPITAARSKQLKSMAAATLKKDARINIRLSSATLLGVQQKAAELGMPYQTLIASVVHQYSTGRLIASL